MRRIATAAGLVALGTFSLTVLAASHPQFKKTVITSNKVKATLPLRELAKPIPKLTEQRKIKLQKSGDLIPGYNLIKEIPNRFPFKDKEYKKPKGFVDKSVQSSMPRKELQRLAPVEVTQFDGVSNVLGYVPPDTNGDVGPEHYVQTVNSTLGIFNKDGTVALAPTNINVLWSGFGGLCESTNAGDPIVLYDSSQDRWLISQFAFDGSMTDNHQCIAISQTGDPTGAYFLYDFPYGSKFNDYPKFGIWTDGYYMGVNQFNPSFAGGGVVAFERDKMLIGAPAQQVIFDMEGSSPTVFTPMPLDMDGFLPPPVGAKEYFVWTDLDTADKLQVWQFDVNWADTNSSTFTQVTEIPVTPYFTAPSIPQPNGQDLDSLSLRTMFRAAYRNVDGQGKVVVTHNIAAPAGQGVTALRWYEVDVDQLNGTASLSQEGTFAPDTTNRWMGSAALDANGNMAVGYSMASSDMNPSIGLATRLATDPVNTLTDEVVAVAGEGSQSGASRWGDYSSMSIDPVDDCTFWYTTEYYKAADDGSTGWSTKVIAYKLPSCTTGPRGEISGTITDSVTGDPIASAIVTSGLITTKTDSEGVYTITMPVGDQAVTAYRYGWVESTAATVTVVEDQTSSLNITLAGATPAVVSGSVKDGGGRNNGLYAKITVSAPGEVFTTFTNPETGDYSISLFEGTTVNIRASETGTGGYLATAQDVLPTNTTAVQSVTDFSLPLNSDCTAPGYSFVLPSFFEGFDAWPATGWNVVDNDGSGVVWDSYLGAAKAGSISGVESDAAFVDSDAGGSVNTDSELVSPVINVADISSTTLYFDALFRTFSGADSFDVDINVDGAGWVNIGAVNNTNSLDTYTIDLSSQLNAATSFQVRFHYFDAFFEWYALVDNVSFGIKTCAVNAGELKSGFVTDANTNLAINGATLAVDGEVLTTSVSTPNDDALNDGFFQLFVADGATSQSVSKLFYTTASPSASVLTLATPVALDAGLISTDLTEVSVTQTAGRSAEQSATVSNDGTALATFNAFLIKGDASSLLFGRFDPSGKHFGPKNLNDLTAEKARYHPESGDIKSLAPGEVAGFFPTAITYGWGISRDRNTGEFWIGDLKAAGAPADVMWRYEADGTLSTDSIAMDYVGDSAFSADSAFNQRTGMLWQVDSGTDNCIHQIDTANKVVTGNTICPAFAVAQRGLAYDPVTNTFYSGSWNDSIIHQFDMQGNLIRSVNVGLAIAGLAYNAETRHLFISVNGASADGDFDIVVVDAASPDLVKVGGYDVRLDIDGDGVPDDVIVDNGQAGLDIDCNGNLWIVDQSQQFVVGFDSGETGACEWNNVPWLSLSASSGSIDSGANTSMTYTLNSAGMTPGDYAATIVFSGDTPYGDTNVPVSMSLTEPDYGSLGFKVTSVEVKEGGVANITVARTGGSDYAVSIDYETLNGSALVGTNFTATSGTLNWDDLDTSDKTITVATNELDEDLSFSLVLSNPLGGAAMDTKVATVTIKDQPKGGGSLTWGMLLFFGLISLSRKRMAN